MIHDPYIILPLPDSWPYDPGRSLRPLGCRINLELPGLGGGWRVCTPGGMPPVGDAVPLEGAHGRGGILRAGDTVMRPYRRGGLLRHINERTYRTHLRFAAEYAVHRGLWEAGFPTVEPLGYAWRPVRFGVEGVMFTRWAEGDSWPRNWEVGVTRTDVLRQAIGALCDWGLWSPDLNATNILFPPDGGILLLDWDRARFEPQPSNGGEDLWPRYRARLERSLRKLGAPAETLAVIGPARRP
ncbi:lipopolysaccharide kinase InaA family protein [Geothrix sp. 21YS21S-4]|uniref:lipopolysaccharide kinase InaA family protein n=1 Tax=Geothrix sp. 21YS21S-4 TaxID=3068889 RepID=UPI0027BAE2A6|nr:lipopolysaccharide kinase InaA family protein [Geothrix sp. 21YS21S-4]